MSPLVWALAGLGAAAAVLGAAVARRRLAVAVRVLRGIATDRRLPRPLRCALAAGLLPIPGPFDEIALGIAAVVAVLFYRPVVRQVISDARGPR
ncbi:MAG TPA: hypothetical protein VF288_10730 [Mycobacteriales bacterium]